jgi:hypothetical protein
MTVRYLSCRRLRETRNKRGAIDGDNCECEIQCILTMRKGGHLARLCVLLAVVLSLAGCATAKVNSGFPDVPLREPHAGATKIGVARVEDSRASSVAGSLGPGWLRTDLLAGPNLLSYIDHEFRNGLAERGFDPVVALDPAKASLAQPYKIVVITLQSATYGFPVWIDAGSSIAIAVQVYAPPHKMIFADSYSGAHSGKPAVGGGSVIAVAADEAVKAALADPKLENALR